MSEDGIMQHLMSSNSKEGRSRRGTIASGNAACPSSSGSIARRRSRKASLVSVSTISLGDSGASPHIGEASASAEGQPLPQPEPAVVPSAGPSAELTKGGPSTFRLKWLFVKSLTLRVDYNVRVGM
jgi:hypothetical protein